MAKRKFDARTHELVPEHSKLSDKEKKGLLENYQITPKELPKMRKNDPAIEHLNVKEGDIVKITRKSKTAGESIFYRGVINV
jgi:DNA-directed RNA polymerase subunit H